MSDADFIPKDPRKRNQLRAAIVEGANSLQRIEDEREIKKEIVNALYEEFDIPKKLLNKLIGTVHKRNFYDIQTEHQTFEEVYDLIMSNPSKEDDE